MLVRRRIRIDDLIYLGFLTKTRTTAYTTAKITLVHTTLRSTFAEPIFSTRTAKPATADAAVRIDFDEILSIFVNTLYAT